MFSIRSSLSIILVMAMGTPSLAQQPTETKEERDARFLENRQKQAAEFKKWKTETQGIFTVYSPPVGQSKVITFIGDSTWKTEKNKEAFTRLYTVAESACPGFNNVKIEPSVLGNGGGAAYLETAKNYCSLNTTRGLRASINSGQSRIAYDGSPFVFVLLLNPNSDPKPASPEISTIRMAGFIQSQLTPLIKHDGTPQARSWETADADFGGGIASTEISNTSETNAGQMVSKTPSTDLKAAMDAIPAAHRPIGVVYTEGEWDSYNMSISFTPHILFPNGIAISPSCTEWNPMQPITKTSAMGCFFYTYTLKGSTAYLDSKGQSIHDYQGFKKGERVSVNFSNIGGLANNGLNPPGANATWGGDLSMSPSGRIQVGSWSGSSMSGPGYTAHGGQSRRGIEGEYYLDGFMIGVKDASGGISVSPIWQQNGRHIFLNGEQYNR